MCRQFFLFAFKKSSLEFSGHYPHTSFISLFNRETRSPRSHSTSAVMQTSRDFFSKMKKIMKKSRLGLLSTIIHYYPRTLFIAIPFLSTKKRGHSIRSHSTSAVVQTSQDFFCKMTSDCTSTNYFQIERQQCFLIVPLLFSMSSKNLLYLRSEIYPCRHCRQQCKIFASGVIISIFTHFLVFLSKNCWNLLKLRV